MQASFKPDKLRAAIILDGNGIKRWQSEALAACADSIEIELILSCRNTRTRRSYGKHFLYYVINVSCLRGTLTTTSEFGSASPARTISFDSLYERNWQSLPAEVIAEINDRKLDLIIKFGMNLLTVPDNLHSRFGILSYHHGDPAKYRGRPAGYYELLNNEDRIGIIVQRLSNTLDGGDICAIAYSKIWHTYTGKQPKTSTGTPYRYYDEP
jgi:hypothetical protein